ncbi:putative membrane protein [Helicobacter pylori NQ4053]|uniref:Putative membrane protein n=1 Tax=Helicobacter pylori NQ4053 TaxID=992027 RepID=J0J879_HELPX|nr:putative membrane protein [Helicobacter pylori NQ4053]
MLYFSVAFFISFIFSCFDLGFYCFIFACSNLILLVVFGFSVSLP